MTNKPSYKKLESQISAIKNQNDFLIKNSSSNNKQVYHSLINFMEEGFAHCRMIYKNNRAVDFIYLEVNKAFEKITGLKNVIGKHVSDILINHKEKNPELFSLYERVSRTGLSEKIETYVSELKTWFSLSVYSTQKEHFIVIFDNITERKRSEDALRISEEQFRGLFTQSHVGTAIVGLDKTFIRCNKAFCNFLGYPEKEIIGKTISDFTYPQDLQIGMSDMKRIVNGEVNFAVVKKRYVKKDGSVVWGELTISLVRGEDNKPLYFLPVIQDITERHKAETALKKSEKNLKKLNATKDKLFTIIAHDLRSPFGGFLGFSELLINSINQSEFKNAKRYANILNSSAKNTLILLENLLNWAKSQSGQIEFKQKNIDLSSTIQEVLAGFELQSISKNISIQHKHSNDLEVYADKNLLKIILQNLISNALKFTNRGGKINVVVYEKMEHVEISVIDNGIGMNKDISEKLFDFSINYTTNGTENEKGSGLGLILCKEFVEKHGGRIWVTSQEGKGSNFIFTLPLYQC